jgi:Arm DNA-binding domain
MAKNGVSPKNALTPDVARLAVPRLRVYRLSDGGSLALEVFPNGGKRWRFRYRFNGKPNTLSCGVFPAVTLDAARARRDEFKSLLVAGIDPSTNAKNERASKREEAAKQTAATRFSIDSDGVLSFHLVSRRLILTPAETTELRAFLDATSCVIPKVTLCP